MREIFSIPPEAIRPDIGAVLRAQGVPPDAPLSARTERMAVEAIRMMDDEGRPVALFEEVTRADFAAAYAGEGMNEPETPLDRIEPVAEDRALFALTLGQAVCDRIAALFDGGDPALGAMLDAAASEAADRAVTAVEARFRERLDRERGEDPARHVLAYSPGYCGWHVSAQRRLFTRLRPEEIGIRLRESFLMDPLKSVSGALLSGPARIHRFEARYPFCRGCRDRTCRDRIAALGDD
ncbi:MAG: hypothetical protein JW958_00480 [Candidatus Eisenbacteria bacterium]|nr:hypothetical protein [Candidatus Eisenbacteria bacterium]